VQARSHTGGATQLEGLSALQSRGPYDCPSTKQRVRCAARVAHELLAFPKRQFVLATEVNNVADIEIRQSVVGVDSHAGYVGCTIAPLVSEAVQQIVGVRANLRIRVGKQEAQTIAKFLLHVGLQAVIVATSFGDRVAGALGKVWEREATQGCWQRTTWFASEQFRASQWRAIGQYCTRFV